MLKRLFKSKNGEGYVDTCIGVLVFVMVLVVAINLFSFVTLRVEMEQIADNLIETATYSGCFGDEFVNHNSSLQEDYYYYDLDYGAEQYFNSTYLYVQIGDTMWVKVSKQTYIKGLGVFKIPITVTVKCSGISERYWK